MEGKEKIEKRASQVKLKMGKRTNRVQMVDPSAVESVEDAFYMEVRALQKLKQSQKGEKFSSQLVCFDTRDMTP